MFDLITGKVERPLRHQSPAVAVLSVAGHIVVVAVVVGVPLLFATSNLPVVPTMMAFAVPEAPPPPPPPPPPPAPAASQPQSATPKGASTPDNSNKFAAPIDAPSEIRPEPAAAPASAGVPGGVEGGIEGGVVGGIVGGLVGSVVTPPPPPPPPPKAAAPPVRVGGQLSAPALLTRVEPAYPEIAVAAKVQGVVILEANVNTDGHVTDVKVLRSIHFLDKAAMEAVREWKYAPLTLNGVPTPFVITVTVSFSLNHAT